MEHDSELSLGGMGNLSTYPGPQQLRVVPEVLIPRASGLYSCGPCMFPEPEMQAVIRVLSMSE